MPYPIANVPVPQAGISMPFMQQYGALLGLGLGGLLPMLLGRKSEQQSSPSPAPSAVTLNSPVAQAANQQGSPQAAQPTQAQPAQTADQTPQQAPQQSQSELGQSLLQRIAPLLNGGNLGGLGGLGGTNPTGMGTAPAAGVQPNSGAKIEQPNYAGTGVNPQLLQMYSQGGMQPNQFGGIAGPAGLNPLAQMQQRLAMLRLTGGGGNGTMGG